jgi:FkbM family methyltransferase
MLKILQKLENILKRIIRIATFVVSDQSFFLYSKQSYNYHNISFSQEGEDLILARFIGEKKEGFYIDVGAHHPQRFSNTYLFYLKGWKGINIDAMPKSMKAFQECRPRDINLEKAISDTSEQLVYYSFEEPALNGFNKKVVDEYTDLGIPVISETIIKTFTLFEVLEKYLPVNQGIDFLSIDVEGLDYQVLSSNDWEIYRPKFVLIEILSLDKSFESLNNSDIVLFMKQNKYKLCAKSFNSLIFRDYLDHSKL